MLVTRQPRSRLVASFVSSYWYCQLSVSHDVEVVFPSAQGQLVIGLHQASPDLSVLVGPSTKPSTIDPTQQRRAIGISLRVGAASVFCRENAKNLVDQEIELEDIWGPEAAGFIDQLRCFTDPDQLFDLLDAALQQRLSHEYVFDPNVIAAEQAIRHGIGVGQIPSALQTDRRKLARSFSETVGLGLKSYSRLYRFRAAVSRLRTPSNESMSMIAASLGYADQAHLTREVKEFSGVTPGVLRSQPSTSPHHLLPGNSG